MNATGIWCLSREFEWWMWLCCECLGRRYAAGWHIRGHREPPHELPCDDCRGGAVQLGRPA